MSWYLGAHHKGVTHEYDFHSIKLKQEYGYLAVIFMIQKKQKYFVMEQTYLIQIIKFICLN